MSEPTQAPEIWTIADVKGQLALHGVGLSGQTRLVQIERPPSGEDVALVIVEQVQSNPHPNYDVKGYATCVVCGLLCSLDWSMANDVMTAGAYPVCLACADLTVRRGILRCRCGEHDNGIAPSTASAHGARNAGHEGGGDDA